MDFVVNSAIIAIYYFGNVILSMDKYYPNLLTTSQVYVEATHYMSMLEDVRERFTKTNDVVSHNLEHALVAESEEKKVYDRGVYVTEVSSVEDDDGTKHVASMDIYGV
ncbi:hypothetical protein ACFE04_029708 [Oxalis oulophora]